MARWMIAVTVVALALGCAHAWRQHLANLEVAAVHRRQEADLCSWVVALRAQYYEGPIVRWAGAVESDYIREAIARATRWACYHAKLKTSYERAAPYPWLPVEPDPPEPD